MHPAEKELINGALEQIEASCRTLRRYLAYCARERTESRPQQPAQEAQGFSEPEETGEDQLERMLSQMMMGMGGGANVESSI